MNRIGRMIKRLVSVVCICFIVLEIGVRPASAASGVAYLNYMEGEGELEKASSDLCNDQKTKLAALGYSITESKITKIRPQLDRIKNSEIVLIVCHGNTGYVSLEDGRLDYSTARLYLKSTQCKLVYLNCCSSAANDLSGRNVCAALV